MSGNIETATVPFVNPKDVPATPPIEDVVAPVAPVAEVPPVAPAEEVPPVEEPKADFTEIMAPYQTELATTGELTSESLGKLAESLGAPPELVAYTYKGMQATKQERDASILEVAGGQEAYVEMVNWASGVFTPEEAQAFNSTLVSGTKADAQAAVAALGKKFTAVNGTPKAVVAQVAPKVSAAPVAPRAPADPSLRPFVDFSALMLAQRDPRYNKDSEYTQQVVKRLSISTFK